VISLDGSALRPPLREKWRALVDLLRSMGSVGVGFSGGVDSGLLCAAAFAALGERMAAFTVLSPVESPGDTQSAQALAAALGFRHIIVEFDDFEHPDFVANPPDRCYHCKLARFRRVQAIAETLGIQVMAEGTHADDAGDYRPGMRAVTELGMRSPLKEAGLSKADVRALAKGLGLPVWDRPSSPCLATRFPYGTPVTREGIEWVARAEQFLGELGFQPVRVRYYGDLARIEVGAGEIARLVERRAEVVETLRSIGFTYVDVDLAGYRSGSMNENLNRGQ
jgi:uncharacterized protein